MIDELPSISFFGPGLWFVSFCWLVSFIVCVGNIILKLWNVYLSMVGWMDVYFYRRVKI